MPNFKRIDWISKTQKQKTEQKKGHLLKLTIEAKGFAVPKTLTALVVVDAVHLFQNFPSIRTIKLSFYLG